MNDQVSTHDPQVSLDEVVSLFFSLGVLPAVMLVGWQIWSFLKVGSWHGVSLADALVYLGSSWAQAPETWLGVHKILSFLPISPFLLVLGPITAAAFGAAVYYFTLGISKVFRSR